MSIQTLDVNFQRVREWAEARNLIEGATPQAQFTKLIEEISEFTLGIDQDDIAEITDGLGDSVVVLTIVAAQCGTDIETCIASLDGFMDEANKFTGLLSKAQSVDGLLHTLFNAVGELANGISKKNLTKVEYGIGAAFRIIEAISFRFDTTIEENFDASYNIIKDRKGKMIDGAFIKEEDLPMYGIAS